jgi:multiple sugar transport system ATP-binding protein
VATVEARGLGKRFGEVRAVDGVDLLVKEGEFLVLLGPSGCGKTTLLRIVAGLERPTTGEILIGGRVVNDLPPRARKIAMVFQSYALYPHMSVFKNIAFPLKAAGLPRAEIPKRVEWSAGLFGIGHLLERKPRQLSGGERQRVALARAVVREPAVFLLDEPLSNLDAKLRASARDELQQFQRRIGTTTVYVTHDQIEAMGLGDRIVVMQGGRVRQIGTPADVYDEPADTFVAAFLGSPPMNLVETAEGLVGFRPEHLLPRETHADAAELTALRFRITRIEYLGADRLLYGVLEGRFDGASVIARLATTVDAKVQAGRTQEFAVRTRDLKFFDRAGLRTPPRPL